MNPEDFGFNRPPRPVPGQYQPRRSSPLSGLSSHPESGDLPTFDPLAPASLHHVRPSDDSRYDPLSWTDYFSEHYFLDIPDGKVSVYQIGQMAPHRPLLILHHGAGHSALSWALFSKSLSAQLGGNIAIVAIDCRNHGRTELANPTALSLEQLTADLAAIIEALFARGGLDPKAPPHTFLAGHSLGGAVVVNAARPDAKVQIPALSGVIVLDVVGGTAHDAVISRSVHRVLQARPSTFPDIRSAIAWCVTSQTVRNLESARVSVPSIVTEIEGRGDAAPRLRWVTDLFSSEPYWSGWFPTLSEDFLKLRCARLLVLAGHDRLDETLLIGQMQGLFQFKILPQAGHCVQEDQPGLLASTIEGFVSRYSGARLR
ncbi:hypothetical protein H696_02192 [Fonticula alba]|uniref:Protein phosphatase methylesterase 1 n=1 Tax=Fonticula alba TaxID=691883 RepID=A0A058ZCS8_FONAL|nr:hypothetical protein H696_02192 [Fonticula alba]KCV71242.1 hypothetical protein H696_02192 [Fonticula alba]|eukprot:XP_009494365.1 hypothetical protein H696_02192 [Fonticula alba]